MSQQNYSISIFSSSQIHSVYFFFFFSSRRRHTRCSRDWSSDVCSSDLLTAILFGLVPALRASNVQPGDALTGSRRTSSGDVSGSRLRNALVVGEIALSVMLLASAGIVMREVIREFSQPLGFNPLHLVIADLRLDSERYATAPARIALFRQVTETLRHVPGIESVGQIGRAH